MTKDEEIKIIEAIKSLIQSCSAHVTYDLSHVAEKNFWGTKIKSKKTILTVVLNEPDKNESIRGIKINGKHSKQLLTQLSLF